MVPSSAGGIAAVVLAASTADLLWSLGVFVGVPGLLFAVLVVRELRALRAQRARDKDEARSVCQEGYPPGPPVESDEQTPE
jgi:hypothetical protein